MGLSNLSINIKWTISEVSGPYERLKRQWLWSVIEPLVYPKSDQLHPGKDHLRGDTVPGIVCICSWVRTFLLFGKNINPHCVPCNEV